MFVSVEKFHLASLKVLQMFKSQKHLYRFYFPILPTGVFLALGCSGIFPVIHIMVMHGVQKGSQQMSLGWLILMGFCYILGAVLYAMRIPERFFPGRCNLLVSSTLLHFLLFFVSSKFNYKQHCIITTKL